MTSPVIGTENALEENRASPGIETDCRGMRIRGGVQFRFPAVL